MSRLDYDDGGGSVLVGDVLGMVGKLVFLRPTRPQTAEELERRTDRFVAVLDSLGCTVCIRGTVTISDDDGIVLSHWSFRWRDDPWGDIDDPGNVERSSVA